MHVHPAFDCDRLLTSAAMNFAAIECPSALRVLALTESANDDWFGSLSATAPAGAWRLEHLGPLTARFAHARLGALHVLAGHQIVCAEGVEVLTLGMGDKLSDGQPAREVIEAALAAAALPVLPWGFGKWIGARGRVVETLLDAFGPRLALGDNGGRLRWTKPADLLIRGRAAGHALLPGSDPLPWSGEEDTVARRGIWIDGEFAPESLTEDLHQALASGNRQREFGAGESTLRFCRNQLVMQWRKRVGS